MQAFLFGIRYRIELSDMVNKLDSATLAARFTWLRIESTTRQISKPRGLTGMALSVVKRRKYATLQLAMTIKIA